MGKRVRLALTVLAVAGLGVVAWRTLRQREPVYQGERLSSWLADLDLESTRSPEKALQAVRAIGTNALPVLMKMVCAEDPLWKRGLIAFNARQSFIQVRISPASLVRYHAVEGYSALGPAAKNAVDALIEVMKSGAGVEVRADVASALGAIGPEARQAIPVLWKAARGQNPELRQRAVFALGNIQLWDQGAEGIPTERRGLLRSP
jgi:HEAT repeat protein